MRKSILFLSLFVIISPSFAQAADVPALAVLKSVTGGVSVGIKDVDAWSAATEGMPLGERQIIRTDAASRAVVVFSEGNLSAVVGEKTSIGLADLLLKTRLDAMRSKVTAPDAGAGQTKLTVTPLTGVRGTEQGESKVDDPLRSHHWEENAAPKSE